MNPGLALVFFDITGEMQNAIFVTPYDKEGMKLKSCITLRDVIFLGGGRKLSDVRG